jgi:hypothetical protein
VNVGAATACRGGGGGGYGWKKPLCGLLLAKVAHDSGQNCLLLSSVTMRRRRRHYYFRFCGHAQTSDGESFAKTQIF